MSEFQIKCPNCQTLITADDVFQKQLQKKELALKEKYKNEIQEELIKKNADLNEIKNLLKKERENAKLNKEKVEKEAKKSAEQVSKEEIDKIKKKSEIEMRRLQNKINEMKIDQKSMEIQGEVQEELIEDFITKKFPFDNLNTIKKGVNGADSILTIISDNIPIGKILIESKNTIDFQKSWIQKLLNDIKNQSADVGLLITKALPKTDFPEDQAYGVFEGGLIWVVEFKYLIVHLMIEMLRNAILESKKNRNTENTPVKFKKLWDVINGPTFTAQFRLLYNNLKKADYSLDKIDSTVRREVANQKKQIQSSIDIQKEIILKLVSTLGTESLPQKLIKFDEHE